MEKYSVVKLWEKVDLKGSTAIIPTIGVANVPQLTADLLINNMPCRNIGMVYHESFLPYSGPDPFVDNSSEMCSCAEVYYCDEKKTIVFQFRSPLTEDQGDPLEFFNELCNWLKSQQICEVIILASIYSEMRLDCEIQDDSSFADFRYVMSPIKTEKFSGNISTLNCSPFLTDERLKNCSEDDDLGIINIGGSFAHYLFKKCLAAEIPTMLLLKFSSDGYNIPDSENFVALLNGWLKILPSDQKLRYPLSWTGLFEDDTSLPPELYVG